MYASTIGGGAMTVVFRASEPVIKKADIASPGTIAVAGHEEGLPATKLIVPANSRPQRRRKPAGKKSRKIAA